MRFSSIYLVFGILMVVLSCTTDEQDVLPREGGKRSLTDSVSFLIDGKAYVYTNRYMAGVGNKQFNIKPSETLLAGQSPAYETGGYYWYGEKDYVLYGALYGFTSSEHDNVKISFYKKYNKNNLQDFVNVLVPEDNSEVFQVGECPMAVDLNLENTMDGVAIEVLPHDIPQELTTYIPAFSILHRTNLPKTIQNDSKFEIKKVEKLDDDLYIIEAEFEVNLFDKNEKLYKLEKGFLRLRSSMKVTLY